MSNAERQKRYRDGKRNSPVTESVSFAPAGVTGRPKNVTRVTVEGCNAPKRNAQADGIVIDEAEPRTRLVPIPGDAEKLLRELFTPCDPSDVRGMSDDELVRRLHYITDWQRSPEHQEVMRRRAVA